MTLIIKMTTDIIIEEPQGETDTHRSSSMKQDYHRSPPSIKLNFLRNFLLLVVKIFLLNSGFLPDQADL
jgi:hypothetical protein